MADLATSLLQQIMVDIVKRLVIKASNNYDSGFKVVPVNTNKPLEIQSEIGVFTLCVYIKNFDGARVHQCNSLYNFEDTHYLDSSGATDKGGEFDGPLPNLRLEINFRPKQPIKGSDLVFGNDLTVPVRDYIPTALLASGLKFFTWFINKTIKGDIYNDKPYLYGLALNSFTFLSLKGSISDKNSHVSEVVENSESKKSQIPDVPSFVENLNANIDNVLQIPEASVSRRKFFGQLSNCESFVFNEATDYKLQFDTNFVKMADSQYAVAIPTYGNRTFDINVSKYANEKLNNFNWVIKQGGIEGVGSGLTGLIINFALADEPANAESK